MPILKHRIDYHRILGHPGKIREYIPKDTIVIVHRLFLDNAVILGDCIQIDPVKIL